MARPQPRFFVPFVPSWWRIADATGKTLPVRESPIAEGHIEPRLRDFSPRRHEGHEEGPAEPAPAVDAAGPRAEVVSQQVTLDEQKCSIRETCRRGESGQWTPAPVERRGFGAGRTGPTGRATSTPDCRTACPFRRDPTSARMDRLPGADQPGSKNQIASNGTSVPRIAWRIPGGLCTIPPGPGACHAPPSCHHSPPDSTR